jgi:hypothetical protein
MSDFFKLKQYASFIKIKITNNGLKYQKVNVLKVFLLSYFELILSVKKRNFIKTSSIVYSNTKYQKLQKNIVFNRINCNENNYLTRKLVSLSIKDFLIEFCLIPIYSIRLLFNKNIDSKWRLDFIRALFIMRYLKSNHIKEIIFFGFGYDLLILSLAILAKSHNIKTTYCEFSGFSGFVGGIISDEIICRTQFQKNYLLKSRKEFLFNNLVISSIASPLLDNKLTKTVGVYTSGFYARLNANILKDKYLKQGLLAEKTLIQLSYDFAIKNKNVQVVLYIHTHGGVENFINAKEHYKKFLLLPNVRLQQKDENSIDTFNQINLSLTSVSEIFFDRVEQGYKAGLVGCFETEFCDKAEINKALLNNINDIEKMLKMSEEMFFNNLGLKE